MALTFGDGVVKKQFSMGGKGSIMMFKEDPTKAPDAPNHHWMEAHYDGRPGSWCPDIGMHWHKHHEEYHKVLQGKISFTVDGHTKDYTPDDPEIYIPRLARHGFKFYPGVETRLRERTNPVDIAKNEFFEDLLEEGSPTFLTAMRSFYNGDTYVALPGGFSWLDVSFTTVVGGIVNWWKPKKGPREDEREK